MGYTYIMANTTALEKYKKRLASARSSGARVRAALRATEGPGAAAMGAGTGALVGAALGYAENRYDRLSDKVPHSALVGVAAAVGAASTKGSLSRNLRNVSTAAIAIAAYEVAGEMSEPEGDSNE